MVYNFKSKRTQADHISFVSRRLNEQINRDAGLEQSLPRRIRRQKKDGKVVHLKDFAVVQPYQVVRCGRSSNVSVSIRKKDIRRDLCRQLTGGLRWALDQMGQSDVVVTIAEKQNTYELTTSRIPF